MAYNRKKPYTRKRRRKENSTSLILGSLFGLLILVYLVIAWITGDSQTACIVTIIMLFPLGILVSAIQTGLKARTGVTVAQEQPPVEPGGAGVVYVIRCGDRYKIGMTHGDANKRLASLQTGTPWRIELIHTITTTDAADLEYRLHAMFAAKRIQGEWFALDEADVELLKRIQ